MLAKQTGSRETNMSNNIREMKTASVTVLCYPECFTSVTIHTVKRKLQEAFAGACGSLTQARTVVILRCLSHSLSGHLLTIFCFLFYYFFLHFKIASLTRR